MRLRPFLRKLKSDIAGLGPVVLGAAVAGAFVAGAAYASVRHVWPSVVEHPYFALKTVKVACDTHTAEAESLAARAGLYEGTSLWQVDVEGAEDKLRAATWVREASVDRRFPDHVSVEVKRRVPVASTMIDGEPYLLDGDGVVYREEGRRRFYDVPYVSGWQDLGTKSAQRGALRQGLAVIAALAAERLIVSELHIDANAEYWLYPDGWPVRVRLGAEPRPVDQARTLAMTLERLPDDPGSVSEIDLMYADRAILRVDEAGRKNILAYLATREQATRAEGIGERG